MSNQLGKTPQQMAEEKSHKEIVDMLKAVTNLEQDQPVKQGTLQKIRNWWQRNRQEIKLVSSKYNVVLFGYYWLLFYCNDHYLIW